MDYDLWIRLARHFRFGYLEEYLSRARMYSENKTMGERDGVFREVIAMTARHFGETSRNWTVAYVPAPERKAGRTLLSLPARALAQGARATPWCGAVKRSSKDPSMLTVGPAAGLGSRSSPAPRAR